MKKKQINWREFKRVVVFIDAANLEHAAKDLKIRIRYAKLKRFLERKAKKVVEVRFYSARFDTNSHDRFFTFLKKHGFKLVTKPVKKIVDDKVGEIRKANVDVEITVDALKRVNKFDTMILFSGDSDFDYLIKELQRTGKKVIVISTKHHVARELIERCDLFVDLRRIKDEVSIKAYKA